MSATAPKPTDADGIIREHISQHPELRPTPASAPPEPTRTTTLQLHQGKTKKPRLQQESPSCACGHPVSDHLRGTGLCRAGWSSIRKKKCRCMSYSRPERALALVVDSPEAQHE